MNIFDTITAISTPYGKGGVALIRISGNKALHIASEVFEPIGSKSFYDIEPNRIIYGRIYERTPEGARSSIDDGMAVYFKAPRSFTGEDTVEITCHGGILITHCVLSTILAAGARPAEAGEFTRRAFLNGRIDLTEAEALGSLLEAKNTSQIKLASSNMRGTLTKETKVFYDDLKSMLGNVYARIDFPDEDLSDMSPEKMSDILSDTLEKICKLSKTYRTGHAVSSGIKTVICGRTNAGKSSVYNRLTDSDSAIVTDIEGTTRDVLRDTVTLGKTTLCLCDTAGLRTTENTVENIGIEKALAEIDSAELILAVFDVSKHPAKEDIEFINKLKLLDTPIIALLNKTDLGGNAELVKLISDNFSDTLLVSANDGSGFDLLADAVDSLFIDGSIDLSCDAVVTDARQYAALVKASEHLMSALTAIKAGISLDLCCIDVECAMQSLGELEGREIDEEIVSEIFSKFCVGK